MRSISDDKRPVVLIYRVGQLGDTLVSLPAFAAIRKIHPRHRTVLLTDRHPVTSGYVSSWNVLAETGWIDEVIFYEPRATARTRVRQAINLVRKLRGLHPEYAYCLTPRRSHLQSLRDHLFFGVVSGARTYHSGGAYDLPVPNRDEPLPRLTPEWLRLLQIVEPSTGHEGSAVRLEIPDRERVSARGLLDQLQVPTAAPLVAIGPGSKMQAKRWPLERFTEVGRRLLDRYPRLYLAALGSSEEWRFCDILCAEWGERSVNLAGRLSIYGSAAVLKTCRAYLGNDTGAMHLAAMVGTPCVAIFSARDYPGRWDPYGNGHIVLRHEPTCAGCLLDTCVTNRNRCLTAISVDAAHAALESLLTAMTTRAKRDEEGVNREVDNVRMDV